MRFPRPVGLDPVPLSVTGITPTVGATVATLLVGAQPYARVYLSPALRVRTKIGSRYAVTLQGRVDSDGSTGVGLFFERDY